MSILDFLFKKRDDFNYRYATHKLERLRLKLEKKEFQRIYITEIHQ